MNDEDHWREKFQSQVRGNKADRRGYAFASLLIPPTCYAAGLTHLNADS